MAETRLRAIFSFPHLIPEKTKGLLRRYPEATLRDRPVVCWTFHNKSAKAGVERRYGVFESLKTLYEMYTRVPVEQRTGYEIILGTFPQKPHFDLDIESPDVVGDLVVEHVIDVIIDTLRVYGVALDVTHDVVIYTSHGDGKQSYHILLPNHYHANSGQAKAFTMHVRDKLDPSARPYLDMSVCGPLQNFRMLGSTKLGKGRTKIEQLVWSHHGTAVHTPELPPAEAFARSWVGGTQGAKPIPSVDMPEPTLTPRSVGTGDAHAALEIFHAHPDVDASQFKASHRGGIVTLLRKRAGHCPVCNRVHEHDNAYLKIYKGKVYFGCHRGRDAGFRAVALGEMPADPSPDPSPAAEEVQQLDS